MQEFQLTTHIERSPEAVWPYLIDPEKVQRWGNFETFEKITDGPVGKGTRWHNVMRFLGKRLEMVDEVIEYQEGERLVFRPVEAPVSYEIEQRLEATDDGTTVTFEFQGEDRGSFFGKIAEPVLGKLMEHDIRTQLERLKTFVEAET